jgi:hypothetical protein
MKNNDSFPLSPLKGTGRKKENVSIPPSPAVNGWAREKIRFQNYS